ncbi:MAG: AraC family transcriptional regulator [Polyangiaceae bacterium]|nr:AraC family transcriptional regulator [Polyangiaceae bacterium]MCB9605593.1 AraC family transcriptional regulator [Polyangiaceae bacterium]
MSAAVGALIVQSAAAFGVDAEALCGATGFDISLAKDPDARISMRLETDLWDTAARLSGDDWFGISVAKRVRAGDFDVLDYAVRTAPTLEASLRRLQRYNRLVHDAATFELAYRGDSLCVEHRLPQPLKQSRHAAEFTLASLVVIGGQLIGREIAVIRVSFHHAPPPRSTLDAYLNVFGVVPSFGGDCNLVELPRSVTDLGIPNTDPKLSSLLQRHAEALLAQRPPKRETTTDEVRRVLTQALGSDPREARLSAVAARLKLSDRSLQRRLADEGAQFDQVLEGLRRDLAQHYLEDPRIGLAEIGYLLGYSEPSAFHRAFKRWTGQTPAMARAQLRDPPRH